MPDAVLPALRRDLPSGHVVYETLGNVSVLESASRAEGSRSFLKSSTSRIGHDCRQYEALSFGPPALDLDDMLDQTSSNDRPRSVVEVSESSGSFTLALQGGAAYAANSLVTAVKVGPDVDSPSATTASA